jgi:hypothetical protein
MNSPKFLGISLIVSSLIIAGSIVYHAQFFRYQVVANNYGFHVFYSLTGKE